jgi:hypothetical protein
MEQREVILDEIAELQHPELRRPKGLEAGRWRFDPEFGRRPQDVPNGGMPIVLVPTKGRRA